MMATTISAPPREPLGHNEPSSGEKSLIGEPLLIPGEDRAAYDQLRADLGTHRQYDLIDAQKI